VKLLVILPNWLGDALMATPAIEALCRCYHDAELTLVGSHVSIEALKHHPRCVRYYVDETKKASSRLAATYRFAKTIGRHDAGITFRNQLHSSLLLFLTGTPVTAARKSWHSALLLKKTPSLPTATHLVKQYMMLAEALSGMALDAGPLRLHIPKKPFERKALGINPGATYGSAKRWYPEKFAEVAAAFAKEYDIIIFGGPNETEMAEAIADELQRRGIENYTNRAGKTTVEGLCAAIGGLSLFITNDSGPMHVAAAYQVPTVAIFGPTRHQETSQWQNRYSALVRHELECSPCMKRECPLKHHDCMKKIEAEEVISAAKGLIARMSEDQKANLKPR
jgi:heptosyltransferase-2